MTDTVDSTPAVEAPATEEAPVVETVADDAPRDGEEIALPDGKTLFDREFVERLRKDVANYREKARDLGDKLAEYSALDQYDSEDRAVWLNLAAAYAADPVQAADAMEAIAKAIKGGEITPEQGGEVLEQAAEEATDEGKSMTADDVKRIIEERDAEKAASVQQAEVIKGIQKTLDDAGYPDGSIEAMTVLTYATQHKVTLDVAIKAKKDADQKVIDDYVAGKKTAPRTMSGSAGEENPAPPRSVAEASKRVDEYLRNLPRE